MFRPSRVAPSPRDQVVSVDHNGKQWRGKGQGFRACKHIIACMNTVQKYKISGGDFKAYRPHGPRQKVFNPTQWSKSYGVFSFSDIIELQHRNKIPNNLISRVSQTENFQEVEKFLMDEQNGWKSWSDKEKIAYVKDLAGHPDLILYIMLRDFQITKRQSALLREKLFDGIDQVLQFNDGEDKILHQKPQLLEEYVKDREELKKLLVSNPIKDPEVSTDVNKATSEIAEEILKTKGEVKTPAVKTWISSLGGKIKGFLNRFITKFK
jgi:hypothetical protein